MSDDDQKQRPKTLTFNFKHDVMPLLKELAKSLDEQDVDKDSFARTPAEVIQAIGEFNRGFEFAFKVLYPNIPEEGNENVQSNAPERQEVDQLLKDIDESLMTIQELCLVGKKSDPIVNEKITRINEKMNDLSSRLPLAANIQPASGPSIAGSALVEFGGKMAAVAKELRTRHAEKYNTSPTPKNTNAMTCVKNQR